MRDLLRPKIRVYYGIELIVPSFDHAQVHKTIKREILHEDQTNLVGLHGRTLPIKQKIIERTVANAELQIGEKLCVIQSIQRVEDVKPILRKRSCTIRLLCLSIQSNGYEPFLPL